MVADMEAHASRGLWTRMHLGHTHKCLHTLSRLATLLQRCFLGLQNHALHAGKLTLAADLGTFIIESDTQTAAQLSKEEAALYECLQLVGRDISAYLVDGDFSFSGMDRRLVQDGQGSSSLDLTKVNHPVKSASL